MLMVITRGEISNHKNQEMYVLGWPKLLHSFMLGCLWLCSNSQSYSNPKKKLQEGS